MNGNSSSRHPLGDAPSQSRGAAGGAGDRRPSHRRSSTGNPELGLPQPLAQTPGSSSARLLRTSRLLSACLHASGLTGATGGAGDRRPSHRRSSTGNPELGLPQPLAQTPGSSSARLLRTSRLRSARSTAMLRVLEKRTRSHQDDHSTLNAPLNPSTCPFHIFSRHLHRPDRIFPSDPTCIVQLDPLTACAH